MRRLRLQALGMEHDDQTSDRPAARAPALLWRRLTLAIVSLALLALIIWSSPRIAAFVARRMAAQRINELATHTALWWPRSRRQARNRPTGELDLDERPAPAATAQMDRRGEAIEAAERLRAAGRSSTSNSSRALQFGDALDTAKEVMDSLADAGAAWWTWPGHISPGVCCGTRAAQRALPSNA